MYKQSTIVLALFLASTSAISLKFHPNDLVNTLEHDPQGLSLGQYGSPEKVEHPFRPDVGRKEIRPDVW